MFTQFTSDHNFSGDWWLNVFYQWFNGLKEVLYEVRCLKSTEDMILASARIISSVEFNGL